MLMGKHGELRRGGGAAISSYRRYSSASTVSSDGSIVKEFKDSSYEARVGALSKPFSGDEGKKSLDAAIAKTPARLTKKHTEATKARLEARVKELTALKAKVDSGDIIFLGVQGWGDGNNIPAGAIGSHSQFDTFVFKNKDSEEVLVGELHSSIRNFGKSKPDHLKDNTTHKEYFIGTCVQSGHNNPEVKKFATAASDSTHTVALAVPSQESPRSKEGDAQDEKFDLETGGERVITPRSRRSSSMSSRASDFTDDDESVDADDWF